MAPEQDRRISEVVRRERSRLGNFIRRRVPDPRDAEDVLQDVFYELVEANRLLMPIDHVTGWLFRVARNRITDLFRKKKPERFGDIAVADEDDERLQLEDLLPSPDAGPEALYARNVFLESARAERRAARRAATAFATNTASATPRSPPHAASGARRTTRIASLTALSRIVWAGCPTASNSCPVRTSIARKSREPGRARCLSRASWRLVDRGGATAYSVWSTPDGFKRDARHAGIAVATAVMAATIVMAPPSMIGSDARIA